MLLKFLIFVSVLLAVLVFVVLPLAAGPVIAGVLQSGGLRAQTLDVDVDANGLQLLGGRADVLRLQAAGVDTQGFRVDELDLSLRGVALFDRTFQAVDGRLTGVRVPDPTGGSVAITSMELSGQAEATRAVGTLGAATSEALLRRAAFESGVPVDRVSLGNGEVRFGRGPVEVPGRLEVRDGSLLLSSELVSVVLVQPDPASPWRLEEVRVSPDGITVEGTLDTTVLAGGLGTARP